MTDEEFQKAPDWSYWTPKRILKKKCDCPDFCERRVVGCGYDGSKLYLCKNCGQIYELKELRTIRLQPTPAVAAKLRQCERRIK